VDSVARGRVWAGAAAKERGLVDSLGGFTDALAAARKRAGVPSQEELEFSVYGEPRSLFSSMGGEPGVDAGLLTVQPELPPVLKALVRESGLESAWMLEPGLKAVQPFTLSVR
jgi:protease-4